MELYSVIAWDLNRGFAGEDMIAGIGILKSWENNLCIGHGTIIFLRTISRFLVIVCIFLHDNSFQP